jgi:hypothetical protein
MNTNPRIPSTQEEGLDRLVVAYFRSEMPARWPAAPQPWAEKSRAATESQADPSRKSRWALAASVALLIGSCWYLSGHVTDGKQQPRLDLGNGEANPPKMIKDHMAPKAKTP